MAISDKLNYLIETKQLFKDRLNSLGAEIIESTTFRNYLNWLDNFYIGSANKTDLAKNGVVGRTTQNHTIPVEYTRVDYIESSGTQYIDTGVKANQDTITDVTLEINQFTEDYNVYFGSSYQFSSQAYELMSVYRPGYGIDPSIANTYNNGYVYTDTISTNTKYNIRKEKNVAYLDGNIIAEQEYEEFETPVNMYIFATNSNGNADYKSSIKLYKMTISDGTNMIRNFIPCYRNSDNVVGLYDLVNDVFYTNQGTGTFTYGTVIVEPSPDYPLEINNLSGDVEYRVRGQGMSEIFPLSLKSKNLFDGIFRQGMHVSITTANRLASTNAMKSTKNEYYTFSTNLPNIFEYKIMNDTSNSLDTTVVDDTSYTSSGKVTVKCTTDGYLKLLIKKTDNSNLTLSDISGYKFQVEKGNQESSYSPYRTPIELCKIGNYQDRIYKDNGKWYLNKQIGKVVFDGSENWYINTSYTYNVFYRTLGNYARISNTQTIYCEYYKGIENAGGIANFGNNYNNSIGVRTANDNIKDIYISNNSIASVSDFKTWLSTHNTVVYYVLATPTTIEITEENYPTLYSQLLAIQEFLTKYKINKEFLLDYSSPEIEY